MSQILELLDKDTKTALINILQEVKKSSPEMNEKIEVIHRKTKIPNGNFEKYTI